MILFGVFVLVMKTSPTVSVSSFKALPDVEINDVYDSSDTVMETSVTMKEECALICESMGELRCQSFNVRPHAGKIRCEIFDHKPVNGTKLVKDENAKLFERQCEAVFVVASMKERLKDNQTLVTFIDDKGAVYQVRSTDPTPRLIGNYSTVFEGFTGEPDDIMQVTVMPWGDTHLIREGMWFYCYLSVDETHERFYPCPPREQFPIHYAQVTNLPTRGTLRFIANDETNVFVVANSDNVEIKRLGTPTDFRFDDIDPLLNENRYDCNVTDFCPYWPLYEQSSCGLVMSSSEVGIFWDSKFYIYDFMVHSIVRRYSVCRGENASYMFNQD